MDVEKSVVNCCCVRVPVLLGPLCGRWPRDTFACKGSYWNESSFRGSPRFPVAQGVFCSREHRKQAKVNLNCKFCL
jgi:hypothetical protein